MDASIPLDIVSFYRGWRNYVQKTEGWEAARWIVINDLYAKAVKVPEFKSKIEIVRALDSLIEDSRIGFRSQQRLLQSRAYLTQETESVTRETVIQRGIPWIEIPGSVVKDIHAKLEDQCEQLFGNAEIWRDANHPDFRRQISAPEALHRITQRGLHWVSQLSKISPCDQSPSFDGQLQSGSAAWVNMITSEMGKISFIVNSSVAKFSNSGLEHLALHEIAGHVFHYNKILQSKRFQEEEQDFCCLSLHNQDSFLVEGYAQFITYALLKKFETQPCLASIGRLKTDLWLAIRHQNMIDILDGRISVEQAIDRHADYMGDREVLKHSYEATMKSVVFAIQGLTYIPPYLSLMPIADLPDDKLRIFLSDLLTQYHSPQDLLSLVEKYRAREA